MRKLTTKEFIERSEIKHKYKYDYSESKYTGHNKTIAIICPNHGKFTQAAGAHLGGKGCAMCGKKIGRKSKTTEDFISDAIKTHGSTYDYSNAEYKTARHDVRIICRVHGMFSQLPYNHTKGVGCPKCGDENVSMKKTKTTEWFINKAKSTHGDLYDYTNSIYLGCSELVDIECKVHGAFRQKASYHLSGRGCQGCSIGGFKDSMTGCLYVLRSECGLYLKIGISNFIDSRIAGLRRSTPFDFNKIECFFGCGSKVRDMESNFHKVFENAGFNGFDGATEWFHYDNEKLEQLKNYGNSINEN